MGRSNEVTAQAAAYNAALHSEPDNVSRSVTNYISETPGEAVTLHAYTDEDLDTIRADAWDEGARWAAVEVGATENEQEPWLTDGDNPYRAGGTR